MKKISEKYFVHATAVVDEPALIGSNTKIWHFSHIMAGATIGNNCSIGQNVFVGSTARIGNNVKIQNNVSVYENVTLEDYVFCGPSCVFTNVDRPRSAFPRKDRNFDKTLVRKGTTIGANATIVCGITIGKHSFIGAGSVVTRDVPAYALCFGNPARQAGWICECGEKLDSMSNEPKKFICLSCSREYRKTGNTLKQLGD